MAATVRATCPGCQHVLRIPADWADRPVKCKKCGTVMQAKSPGLPPSSAATTDTAPATPIPGPVPTGLPAEAPTLPPGYAPPAGLPGQFPPGYPPPGYQYPPAGYPYPMPPGYGPAPGYAAPPGYPYGMPPGYPPPGYGYPAQPAPGYPPVGYAPGFPPIEAPGSDMPSAFADASPVSRRRRHRSSPGAKIAWLGGIVTAFALLIGLGLGSPWLRQNFLKKTDQTTTGGQQQQTGGETVATDKGGKKPSSTLVAASGPFPRRMLVMSVTKYLYCNALSSGKGAKSGDHVSEVARRLAFDWRVPQDKDNNQLFVLSDSSPKDPRPMLRLVIEQTYTQFCETCRPQDRAFLYYGGHAFEKDGKAYLVPVDGDFSDVESLIPLDDFWAKVKDCKAQQKVVVFDVCRLNEDGDAIRPGGEPMSEALEKKLLDGPPGVQVVTTCAAGQNALEYRQTPFEYTDVAGSLFLSALRHVADKGKTRAGKTPTPDDPIPIGPWVEQARARMKEVAEGTRKTVQSPKFTGSEGTAVALNAEEPPAKRFDLPLPPKGAAVEDVVKVAKVTDLPPLRSNATFEEDPVDAVLPFAADVMKDYKAGDPSDESLKNDPKYRLRKATLAAIEVIRKEWTAATTPDGKSNGLREMFTGETNDTIKKQITAEQETPAKIIQELEDQVRDLEKVQDGLPAEESKFWQAAYLYTLAQLKARLAFMHEYDYALANIKTDSLPMKDGMKGQTGLQLVSAEKMNSKKDIKDIADEAKKLFARVADEHKGTPFAVQAKRAKVIALGLKWQPYTPGGTRKDD